MATVLEVHLYGRHAARLERHAHSTYRLHYTQEWLSSSSAVPLSTSLPLQPRPHSGTVLLRVLEGFLPDNPEVLQRWAREAGLPDSEVFGLLGHYGEDVAGAAIFVPPSDTPSRRGSLQPLSSEEIARRIRAIRQDPRAWTPPENDHRFSLGGAQGKFALARHGESWLEPHGREPSTHIFKPGIDHFEDSDLLEHVVMRVAAELGLPVAGTAVHSFEEERALVVERFDRIEIDNVVHRIHQEDLAQASGTPTNRKYEKDGGPGIARITDLFYREADPSLVKESLLLFGLSLVYSWLIGHNDGHAKNYSLRLLSGRVGLTPLYDLGSFLPYLPSNRLAGRDPAFAHELELAFSIDGENRIGGLTRSHWRSLERTLGLPRDVLIGWGIEAATELMATVNKVIDELPAQFQTVVIDHFRIGAYLRQQSALSALSAG